MVSVDDLTISLKIDPTSELAKLQKQLTALVGEKGEKKIQLGAGVDPLLKRDIEEIKNRIIFLTPTMIGERPELVRYAAGVLVARLEKQEGVLESLAAKIGVPVTAIQAGMDYLINVSKGEEKNIKAASKAIDWMTMLLTQLPKKGGWTESAWKNFLKAMPEFYFQKKLSTIMKAFGLITKMEQQMYQIDPEKIGEKAEKGVYEAIGAMLKVVPDVDKKDFDSIVEMLKITDDPAVALRVAMESLGLDPDETKTGVHNITSNLKLQLFILGQLRAAIEEKKPIRIMENFYNAMKGLFGFLPKKAISAGAPLRIDLGNIKGLDRLLGKEGINIKYMTKGFEDIKEALGEVRPILNKKAVKDILDRAYKEKFKNLILFYRRESQGVETDVKELITEAEEQGKNIAFVQTDTYQLEKIAHIASDITQNVADILELNKDMKPQLLSTLLRDVSTVMKTIDLLKPDVEKEVKSDEQYSVLLKRMEELRKLVKDVIDKTDDEGIKSQLESLEHKLWTDEPDVQKEPE